MNFVKSKLRCALVVFSLIVLVHIGSHNADATAITFSNGGTGAIYNIDEEHAGDDIYAGTSGRSDRFSATAGSLVTISYSAIGESMGARGFITNYFNPSSIELFSFGPTSGQVSSIVTKEINVAGSYYLSFWLGSYPLTEAEDGCNIIPDATLRVFNAELNKPSSTPVPEPSTMLLLGFGLAGVGFLKRRTSQTG